MILSINLGGVKNSLKSPVVCASGPKGHTINLRGHGMIHRKETKYFSHANSFHFFFCIELFDRFISSIL